MKKITSVLALVLMMGLLACGRSSSCAAGQGGGKTSEVNCGEIVKAIEYYIEAGRQGSSEIAKKGFAPTATMSWYEAGDLVSVPIQTLYDGFDRMELGMEVTYSILSCEVDEDVAAVAIDSKFGEDRYTDMFTLVKDRDGWKIVSKVYHVKK